MLSHTLYLHIDGLPELSIEPHTNKDVTVSEGIHDFNVSSPRRIPKFGSKAFVNGDLYTWLWSGDIVSDLDRKASPEQAKAFHDKEQEVANRKKTVDDLKPTVDKMETDLKVFEAKLLAERAIIDEGRKTLDSSDQNAIDEFNKAVEQANKDKDAYHAATVFYNQCVDDYNAKLVAYRKAKQEIDDMANAINK